MPEGEPVTAVIEQIPIDRGAHLMDLELRRVPQGLQVKVKAHAILEAFMKQLSGDRSERASTTGAVRDAGGWTYESSTAPTVYVLPTGTTMASNTTDPFMRFDRWGGPVEIEGFVNMSWARAKGISTEGFTFVLAGVFSTQKVRDIGELLKKAVKAFYLEYVRPVCVSVELRVTE
jgi:hypothetical protein